METVPEKNTLSQILSFLVDLEEQSSLNGQPTIDTSSDEEPPEIENTSSDEEPTTIENTSSDEEPEPTTIENTSSDEEPQLAVTKPEDVTSPDEAEELRLEEEVNLIEVVDAVVFKKKMFWCC